MHIQEHIQLKSLNTLNLDSTASHYVQINHANEVVEALDFAKQNNLNVLVLSEGAICCCLSIFKLLCCT